MPYNFINPRPLQSIGRGTTAIVWQFLVCLSVRPNPPVLTGKGRLIFSLSNF